jgi:hypothetical protein
MGEIILRVIVLPIVAIYALGILLALLFKVFRSQKALLISFAFSAIASVPALGWLAGDLKYLPGQIRAAFGPGRAPGHIEVLLLLALMLGLLLFGWSAPIVQYFLLRSKADHGKQRTT